MRWWRAVVNQAQYTRERVRAGVRRVRNNTTLARVATGALTFAGNTLSEVFEQGIALIRSVPSLIHHSEIRKITNDAVYLISNDILPLIYLHYLNNYLQQCLPHNNEEQNGLFQMGATVVDYGVKAFILRQSVQTTIRIFILDSAAPSAFNQIKGEKSTLCHGNTPNGVPCSNMRFLTGMIKEPLILMSYDLLTLRFSSIPYGGYYLGEFISIIYYGRYITRLATSNRCDRHKSMSQESTFALGLCYVLSTWLMDFVLMRAGGLPPPLLLRALHHLLLLLHQNIAAHRKDLPLVIPGTATIPFDVFNAYEEIWRFYFDVLGAGLKVQLSKKKTDKPLVPVALALKLCTFLFNADREAVVPSGALAGAVRSSYTWIAPPILCSKDKFLQDRIVSNYWHLYKVRDALTPIDSSKTKTIVALGRNTPGTGAVLQKTLGIPRTLTRTLFKASKGQKIWELLRDVRLWFVRSAPPVVTLNPSASFSPSLRGDTLVPQPQVAESSSTTNISPLALLPSTQAVATSSQERDRVSANVISTCSATLFNSSPASTAQAAAIGNQNDYTQLCFFSQTQSSPVQVTESEEARPKDWEILS